MNKVSILLAEDDTNLGQLLKSYLSAKEYDTILAIDGAEAMKIFKKEKFSLCLLDVMMPEMDGFTLAREIRTIDPHIPIIFLTAKNLKEDVIEGFKTGADDYLTKPFSMEELIYRIEAILRRSTKRATDVPAAEYTIGKFNFDVTRQLLTYQDQVRKLTTKETELLELLCRHQNEVLERNLALKSIWIDDNYFNARSMDVYITKLRKYLSKDENVEILNIHGKGYKLLC
ncbi:MAG: response regulator transcription factor [Bacteroidales bacterium]|nr:response regulator transcription factor [Bacteroidales bacterium]MDT8373477.1 response regulator transcription factor [Bacteroidales bacterium]